MLLVSSSLSQVLATRHHMSRERVAGLGAEVTPLASREAGAQLSGRRDPGWGWQSKAGVRPTMGPWAPSSECLWACSGDQRSSPGSLSARSFPLSGRGSCSDWAWFVDVRTSALWSAAAPLAVLTWRRWRVCGRQLGGGTGIHKPSPHLQEQPRRTKQPLSSSVPSDSSWPEGSWGSAARSTRSTRRRWRGCRGR